jgi:cell division ATPase FtsA
MEVFLVAAPKTLVTKYENVVKEAGLELVSIETEGLSLARALIEGIQSPVTLILSVGSERTDIFVTKGGSMLLTYVILSGGHALTRALSSDLRLDQQQSEEYKKTYGLSKDVLSSRSAVR